MGTSALPDAPASRGVIGGRAAVILAVEGLRYRRKEKAGHGTMTLAEFQRLIETMYSAKDRLRGSAATFLWLSEEIGELAGALRGGTREDKAGEFADVLAWVATLANVEEIDLTEAVREKYGSGCPGCGALVCSCEEKP